MAQNWQVVLLGASLYFMLPTGRLCHVQARVFMKTLHGYRTQHTLSWMLLPRTHSFHGISNTVKRQEWMGV